MEANRTPMRKILGDKAFFRSVMAIGLPVALQNLLGTTASMIDTFMIGTQGELAVAAVGISSQFASLLFAAYFGFASGGMLFFAQYWGAKDEKGICRAYGVVLVCMMLVGLLFAGVAVIKPEFILNIYTDKTAIQEVALPYLRIVGYSFPLQVLAMAMSSLLRSTERVKIPLLASIAALGTNLLINWLLIFGKFGLPQMGVAGAAIGTVAASAVNVLVLYAYCMRDKKSFIMRVREHYDWNLSFLKQYFIKSFPIIMNEMFYGIGQMLINVVIGRQAEEAIAAMAVFRVIEGLIYAFFGGLANASSVMVGKRIGAGELREGYSDAKRFAVLCPAITLVICLCILPVREPLLRVFGLGGEALRYGMIMLLIYVVAGTVRTCNYIMNNTFRAGGEPVFGSILEVGGLFLLAVPAIYLTGIVWSLPFLAVFSFMYIDEFVRLFISLRHLRSGRWIKPVTVGGQASLMAFREEMGLNDTNRRWRRKKAK